MGKTLVDLDEFPTPEEAPDYYVDFDETGPYVAEIGDSGVRDVTATARREDADDLASVPISPSWPRCRAELEQEPASSAIKWAWETFGDGAVLAASFQDCVLIDVATQVAPEIEVVFLDTQYHFAETLWYVEQVRERYDLNLRRDHARRSRPTTSGRSTPTSAARCARSSRWRARSRARRRGSPGCAATRRRRAANAPIVGFDVGRGIVKVNPIATWTHDDIDGYIADRGLPVHPLRDKGYPSIGCWPCTNPVEAKATTRAPAAGPAAARSSAASTAGHRPRHLLERPRRRRVRASAPRPTAYERASALVPARRGRVDRRRAAICRRARVVADVAAGTGKFTRLLDARRRRAELVAVEPVEGMRRVLAASLPRVPVVSATAEALPFRDGVARRDHGRPGVPLVRRPARAGGVPPRAAAGRAAGAGVERA